MQGSSQTKHKTYRNKARVSITDVIGIGKKTNICVLAKEMHVL